MSYSRQILSYVKSCKKPVDYIDIYKHIVSINKGFVYNGTVSGNIAYLKKSGYLKVDYKLLNRNYYKIGKSKSKLI